jgi:flagellin-like hook-associated protein FlgL
MVGIVNRSMYPVQTSMNLISKMQERFATLQTQLATGQKASDLAGMGADRFVTLSMQSRISRIEGYQNSIDMVNMRLEVYDEVVGRLDKVESTARASITPSAYGSSNVNFGTVPTTARSSLDELVNLLNTEVDGRYLFAGGSVDKRPVETMSAILDGAGGKAGFKQVAAERLMADQGNGLGRLAMTHATGTDTVSLAEDGAHPFGFKLSTLTGSGTTNATLTAPSGAAPKSASVQFTAQPQEGSSITLGLTLPDGTEAGITLKAVTGTPGEGEFQIGASVGATADNFAAALDAKLQTMAKTELASASNYAAADNFFNGQGQPVLRVQGPAFATATTLVTADPTTTVLWYKGEDAANARTTVSAKIDDAATVNYGVQANESGPVALMRSLAVMSIQSFTNADDTSQGRFDAVATRNFSRLSESHNNEGGSIEMIAAELGNARVNVDSVSGRQDNYKAQLQGMIDDISTVPKEDVAMEILALQTRLQASYQATSLIAQLSLVNYIK